MSEQLVYNYGNHPPYVMDKFWMQKRWVVDSSVQIERPEINRDIYEQNLEDIDKTWGLITDPKTDKKFEIAMANISAPVIDGMDAELSTFTSSISGNPGNAVELAENAALHPDRQRVYIASFGNGGSVYWDSKEVKHIKKTGRFTYGGSEALPTLAALTRALKSADFIITRLSANSAGGAHATALMGALPEGQVTHAYLKSRPNITNHRLGILWGAGVLLGDIIDDRKYARASDDPWKLTSDVVKDAVAHMPDIYSKEVQNRHKSVLQKARSSHKASKMWNDLLSFSRGGPEKDYPAVSDTIQALQNQPEALLTLHFPAQDRLYESMPIEAMEFINIAHFIGGTALADGQIEALVAPGKHRDHTKYPGLRWAAEKYAFGRQL